MVDDDAGYTSFFYDRDGQGRVRVIEQASIAHARRKFFERCATNASPIALEGINRMNALYEIERRGNSIDT